jgi:hypothetical protein
LLGKLREDGFERRLAQQVAKMLDLITGIATLSTVSEYGDY